MEENFNSRLTQVENAIYEAFPIVPPPTGMQIGILIRGYDRNGNPEYHINDDGTEIEAILREKSPRIISKKSIEQLQNLPAKTWNHVVGNKLMSISALTSMLSMTPQARAYYTPSYMITILMILQDHATNGLMSEYTEGRCDPIEFMMETIDQLMPSNKNVQEKLLKLDKKICDPYNLYGHLGTEEEFLCYISQFSEKQKNAISMFVSLVIDFFYKKGAQYPGLDEDIALLESCWLSS